jgi:hypothetical protein
MGRSQGLREFQQMLEFLIAATLAYLAIVEITKRIFYMSVAKTRILRPTKQERIFNIAWVTASGAKQPFEVLEELTVKGFAVAGQSRNDSKSPCERCVLSECYYASFALDTVCGLWRQIRIIAIASYRGAD